MKKTITNACGCDYEYNIIGNSRDRDRKIEWLEAQDCPDCRRAERDKAAAAAVEAATTDFCLPELTGTENQIPWAVRERAAVFLAIDSTKASFRNWLDNPELKERIAASPTYLDEAAEAVRVYATEKLIARTSARFWIDERHSNSYTLMRTELPKDLIKRLVATSDPMKALYGLEEEVEEIKNAEDAAMTLVKSAAAQGDLIARISILGDTVSVAYPKKDDIFAGAVKYAGFRWNSPLWTRVREDWETTDDVAATIAHRLLAKGFHIQALSDIAAKAVSGEFVKAKRRYVTAKPGGKSFLFNWPYPEDFFRATKKLPGAKWVKPQMQVSGDAFREVMDFARIHKFLLTPSALELIAKKEALLEGAASVRIAEMKAEAAPTGRPVLPAEVDPQPLASLVDND